MSRAIIMRSIGMIRVTGRTGMNTTVEARQIHAELIGLRQAVDALTRKIEGFTEGRNRPAIATSHPYITRVQGVKGGEPIIRGKGVTVQTVIALTQRGLTPTQIAEEYEGLLNLAEIYDALAYYHAHQGEIEQYMAENQAARKRTWPTRSS